MRSVTRQTIEVGIIPVCVYQCISTGHTFIQHRTCRNRLHHASRLMVLRNATVVVNEVKPSRLGIPAEIHGIAAFGGIVRRIRRHCKDRTFMCIKHYRPSCPCLTVGKAIVQCLFDRILHVMVDS